MDIVFLALTVVAAILLPRNRAVPVAVAVWAVCLAMVGWGPAHNSDVHTREAGFWVPWCIALAIGIALVFAVDLIKRRRAARV